MAGFDLPDDKYHNLTHYFSFIEGLDNIHAKSKLQEGFNLIKKINIDLNEILLIGDTTHDAVVAKETGIDCVLLTTGHQNQFKLQSQCPNVLNSFKELDSYLFN